MDLSHFVETYRVFKRKGQRDKFFIQYPSKRFGREMQIFDLIMGQPYVREAIMVGKSAKTIRAMWQDDIKRFKKQRRPYLLYAE